MIKKLLIFFLGIGMMVPLLAQAQLMTPGGGTGSTTPTGILIFTFGNLHAQTLTIGSGLTLTGSTLSGTGGGNSFGYPFPGNSTTTVLTFTNGITANVTGNLTGNAGTATALATGRTISITGDLSYTSPTFDGSGNVTAVGTLATVNGNVGSFTNANITVNAKGLITAAANGTAGDTFAWPFTPVSYGNATGTLIGFTGGILSVGSSTFVGNATTTGQQAFGSVRIPTLGVAAGTFLAVDANGVVIATTTPQGSSGAFSPSANYGTVTGLPAYTSAAGVITEVGTGALSVDGNSPTVGQIVLVKNESGACTSSAGTCQNGLYNVTAAGSGIAAFVLTRNSNYNSSSNVIPGIVTYIISGATLADDFWALTTPAPITVGTTGLTYVEVSGGGAAVTSVSNSDSTLTISPTAGAVVASLNLGHSNTWSVLQNFSNATSTLFSSTYASTTQLTVSGQTGCAQFAAGVLTGTGSNCAAASSFPFTPNAASVFFGQVSNSTSTQIHFGATPFALTASSTSVFANASTSLATIFTGLYLGANAEITSFTGTGLAITGGALGLSAPVSLANGGTNATSFTTSNNSVFYNGTSLLTAPLTTAVTTPFASTTALSIGDNATVASTSVGTATGNIFLVHSMSFTLASSTLAYYGAYGASGTTTTVISNPIHSSILKSFFCQTDVGTVWVGFTFGAGTETTETQCTTTGTVVTLSTNNTGLGRQAVKVEVGHEATNPNIITITADVEDKN